MGLRWTEQGSGGVNFDKCPPNGPEQNGQSRVVLELSSDISSFSLASCTDTSFGHDGLYLLRLKYHTVRQLSWFALST